MGFFKYDPVKKLRELLKDLKVSQELWWHQRAQEDLERITDILEKDVPALEGKTIAEAEAHPAIQQEPLFKSIVSLFSRINQIVVRLQAIKKAKGVVDERELKRDFELLDDLVSEILREEYLLQEKRSGRTEIPQEIIGADELGHVADGVEVKFVINSARAVFWTNPDVWHSGIMGEYFEGKKEAGGTIIPQRRIIEVVHSRYDHETILAFFRRLGASERARVLHGFKIRHGFAYIGTFICKHGGGVRIAEEAPIAPGPGGLRTTLVALLRKAEAEGDWANAERFRRLLRETHEGD
jgi:hypothetical protein